MQDSPDQKGDSDSNPRCVTAKTVFLGRRLPKAQASHGTGLACNVLKMLGNSLPERREPKNAAPGIRYQNYNSSREEIINDLGQKYLYSMKILARQGIKTIKLAIGTQGRGPIRELSIPTTSRSHQSHDLHSSCPSERAKSADKQEDTALLQSTSTSKEDVMPRCLRHAVTRAVPAKISIITGCSMTACAKDALPLVGEQWLPGIDCRGGASKLASGWACDIGSKAPLWQCAILYCRGCRIVSNIWS